MSDWLENFFEDIQSEGGLIFIQALNNLLEFRDDEQTHSVR